MEVGQALPFYYTIDVSVAWLVLWRFFGQMANHRIELGKQE
ncbi:hypothetical protein [Paenibacillus baekrokdamisoli]|nr:hypothetical protein [Paenibacillus baekrokdamisoli]